jgi:hypothetical protein
VDPRRQYRAVPQTGCCAVSVVRGRRDRIAEDWQPCAKCAAFARDLELDPLALVGPFVDHHLAKGNLMADWDAAWRTWCRNEVKFSQRRAPGLPLFSVVKGGQPAPADDPWGALAWAKTVDGTRPDEKTGKPMLGGFTGIGYDVAMMAEECCAAATMDPTRITGGLAIVAEWLRAYKDPNWIEAVIKRTRKPAGGVHSLEYFRQPVADAGAKLEADRQDQFAL